MNERNIVDGKKCNPHNRLTSAMTATMDVRGPL